MKAIIFVTLIIVLSMCMVCAACNDEGDTNWYLEGLYDGIGHGCNDGYAGNERNYDGISYPEDCPNQLKMTYRNGYHEGYAIGYTKGEYEASIKVPGSPVVKDEPENCMSSPSMGIGLKLPDGTITQRGDQVPTLYTWAEVNDKYEHHTTLTFPEAGTYTGCVIITPPQIAGEPLVESNFWTSAKGLRILQWKANAG